MTGLATTFGALAIFDTFVFETAGDFPGAVARGPWRKVSDRTYQAADGSGPVYTVGTREVEVIPLEVET